MKRTALILALLLLLFCSGCGKTQADFEISELAAAMLDSSAFSDKLAPADSQIGSYLYGISETLLEDSLFYFSSGATAEELAIFKTTGADAAKTVVSAIEGRIADQRLSFSDYNPDEVPKLDKAVIKTSGAYVLFFVAADNSAAEAAASKYF